MKNIKAVILCGGLGTRLREETEFKPKPAVLVGGRPILWHIMKIYSHYGIKDFILCLGYRGDVIKQYFLDYEIMNCDVAVNLAGGKKRIYNHNDDAVDWNVTLTETGLNTMTGGRVKKIERYIDGDEFMLTYGDGLADVNITSLLKHHRSCGTVGTLTGVNPRSRFGMIKADKKGMVSDFVEKPVMYEDYVNGGFYVFNKEFFDFIDLDESSVLEKTPLVTLAKKKQLSLYRHKGFWHCMDTYRDYLELNAIWDSGKAPWRVWR